jgi:hypothetical protein
MGKVIVTNCYKLDKQNTYNLMFYFKKLLHIPATLAHHQGVQLNKAIAKPYYHLQQWELW